LNKKLMLILFLSLIVIPSILSIEITNESREYGKYWKGISNFTKEEMLFENFDNRNYFIKFLVVPELRVYGTPDTIALWDTKLYFYRGGELTTVDTSSCWNWWSNTSSDWEERQYTDCPEVSFEVKSNEDLTNITMVGDGSHGLPSPQFRVFYYGYTTAFADEDILYSDTRRVARDSISEFFTINLNLWRGAYYVMIIVVVVLAVLFIVGGVPLLIKKLIVKVVGG